MARRRTLAAVLAVAAVTAGPLPAATAAYARDTNLTTVAGTGNAGFSGDGGPATAAALDEPQGVAVAPDGTIYVSDAGNIRVRAISPAGAITTVAGTGRDATTVPGRVRLPDGEPGTEVDLGEPRELAVAADGTLLIVDNKLAAVFKLSSAGRLTVLAGTGMPGYSGDGGPATQATLDHPDGVAVAPDGTVYIGDMDNHRLRAVSPAGVITTAAGSGASGVDGPAAGDALAIPLPAPGQVAVDGSGDVWVVPGGGLYRLSAGKLAFVVLPADNRWGLAKSTDRPYDPRLIDVNAITAGGTGMYVSNRDGSVLRFGVGNARSVSTVARFGQLSGDLHIAVGPSERVFVSDGERHRLYMFRPEVPASEETSRWVFVAGGAAVLICLLLGAWLLPRRRRWARPGRAGQ